jgi:hypothetical protein
MDGVQDERCFNASVGTSAGNTRLAEGSIEEAAYGEAVWSWHPLLMPSLRRRCRANRVDRTFNPQAMVTKGIRRQGERGVSRKAIAQGMSECSPLPCMLVCRHSCALWHMRPRVQRAPGIPCALCFEGKDKEFAKLGQNMSRE